MPRCRRGAASRSQVLFLRLLLVCALVASGHQEETVRSWDKLSQLIPTNSVYEKQDRNASPSSNEADASLAHLPGENNVMDTSKSKERGDHEEEEKEDEKEPKLTYDVEEYEDGDKHEEEELEEKEVELVVEKKDLPDNENGATKKERSPPETSSVSNIEAGDKDGDYLEDLPTNQDDNTYYYYEEYENGNRSRYDAAEGENLDYLDTESEEEDVTPANSSELEHGALEKRDEDVSHESTSNSSRIVKEEISNPISSIELEQGSSMEGSDKTFTTLGTSGKEDPENVSAEVSSILIGGAVVSVVTTKSVVNGTISVPTTASPVTTEQVPSPPSSSSLPEITEEHLEVTTEDSARILASVQTSRSVSGARFLPFPVIDRVEQVEAHSGSLESKKTSQSPSTESIIDKLDWAQSKLSSDLLPAAILGTGGFRNNGNTLQLDVLAERDRTTTTTTTRRSFTTTAKVPVIGKFIPRRYNDRKLNYTSTNTAKPQFETTVDTLEGLLPRSYVSRGTTPSAASKTNFRWPSSKPTSTEVIETKTILTTPRAKSKASTVVQIYLAKSKVDISSLLPPGYDKKVEEESKSKDTTTTTSTTTAKMTTVKNTDISPDKIASSIQDLFASSKVDISALLPKDYEQKKEDFVPDGKATGDANSEHNTTVTERTDSESPTTKKAGGLKIVFPSRPGGRKPIQKITTPQTLRGDGPGTVTPKIQKGWPTRATTEFTGWPTPSTTPISIEKLLEAARTATVSSINMSLIPSTNEISSTSSSTSTTTTTPRPTTPSICDDECEVAGTIRIIGNATWVPELYDRNTHEWQELANHVEREINFIFSKSSVLMKWYKNIRIDSFSQGSILVDYFVELANLQQKVNTQELKVIFHDSLRTYNANQWNETNMKGPLRMGMFTIDPKYTDFVVIPKVNMPQYIEKDDRLIPQWAIAVIVIGVGGLLFIIVFGVSVLVNRQNGSKLKPTMSAIYDEEVIKHASSHRSSDYSKPVAHTIWTDPDVSWNDKSFESNSNKILVDKSFQDKKYNMYDSWRSEWNGYYYNPSHTSSKYGYDSTTNLSSRHHPDYDTNF
ncbi:LOW QUALITY PROTEIN: nuclear pore complex protein DDB_G0274915 [Mycetomoellerius zeteki]|uniref:LOW QUALITY PROTEIN: nuclear pore complex protein DDB_G0274915 n=1 Tax=Mycetomoellerius zeteki TaxID=64791 RepID=UPI00084EA2DD|nr:PREDICTED: LOW QUALITY PROTEIN: nuclear pore complex protein DDB_G0274915 [Trachymyrmex zeteki]